MKEEKFCGELLKQIHDEMEKHANNMLRSHDLTTVSYTHLDVYKRQH